MTCDKCGGEVVTKILDIYQDDGLIGLPNVFLIREAKARTCEKCGEEYDVSIPDAAGLEVAVAVARVCQPVKLNAQEIRFLRIALGLQAKQLAEELEVRPETVSNWENGKDPINPQNEKLLRLMVAKRLKKAAPAVRCHEDQIMSMKIKHLSLPGKDKPLKMAFYRVQVVMQDDEEKTGWRPEEKAVATG